MARMGLKNKQKLKYSLYLDKVPVYARDDDGNIIYDDDGEPLDTGETLNGYSAPVEFMANIAFAGGEAEMTTYGVSVDGYDSKMVTPKGYIPITETSLVFKDSEPQYTADGMVKEKSADFRVIKVAPSLNHTTYLLKRIEK